MRHFRPGHRLSSENTTTATTIVIAADNSALACKYAVTGDANLRKQSEDMLKESQERAKSTPEGVKWFEEYAERIHHRLQSREIIDKTEYDRRFRQGQAAGK